MKSKSLPIAKSLLCPVYFCHIRISTSLGAPHSSTLAWKIPWTGEPGWLQSMGSLELDMTSLSLSLFTFMYWRRKWQPTPVFLPGESRDGGAWWPAVWGGRTESDMTEATLQQQWQQHKHNY